jgi:hypothetical protein
MAMKKIITSLVVVSGLFINAAYAEETPKFDCEISDKVNADNEVNEKTEFTPKTPIIFFVCTSEDVKVGQKIKAVWIAEDTHQVAPNHHEIDHTVLAVKKPLEEDQEWTGKFSLSKPNNDWPIGKYKVQLFAGEHLIETKKFEVER